LVLVALVAQLMPMVLLGETRHLPLLQLLRSAVVAALRQEPEVLEELAVLVPRNFMMVELVEAAVKAAQAGEPPRGLAALVAQGQLHQQAPPGALVVAVLITALLVPEPLQPLARLAATAALVALAALAAEAVRVGRLEQTVVAAAAVSVAPTVVLALVAAMVAQVLSGQLSVLVAVVAGLALASLLSQLQARAAFVVVGAVAVSRLVLLLVVQVVRVRRVV